MAPMMVIMAEIIMKYKFRVESENHCVEIQKALFALGYSWYNLDGDYIHRNAAYLYADDVNGGKCISFGTTEAMYANDKNKEAWLVNGVIVTDKEFQKQEIQNPPIGLRPKAFADAERTDEILEAMMRYTKHGKEIPFSWYSELGNIMKLDTGA